MASFQHLLSLCHLCTLFMVYAQNYKQPGFTLICQVSPKLPGTDCWASWFLGFLLYTHPEKNAVAINVLKSLSGWGHRLHPYHLPYGIPLFGIYPFGFCSQAEFLSLLPVFSPFHSQLIWKTSARILLLLACIHISLLLHLIQLFSCTSKGSILDKDSPFYFQFCITHPTGLFQKSSY